MSKTDKQDFDHVLFGDGDVILQKDIEQNQLNNISTNKWWRACLAGSCAGLIEHLTLYPIDTIKTRLQYVLSQEGNTYKGFYDAFSNIIKTEGPSALFRGLPTVLCAAIPSHAAYFGAFEYSKYLLGASNTRTHTPVKTAISGIFATMAHDFIVTPFDVIKQRMQLRHCPYPNICKCAINILKSEGYMSFFRSYPATVLLNIPVFSTNFVTYESTKIYLIKGTYLESEETWLHHFIAGGIAGSAAGLISNPLDVVKTAIQTDKSPGYKSLKNTIKNLISTSNKLYNNNYQIFLSGSTARMLYFIPSASITWTTYEAVKKYLNFNVEIRH